MQELFLKVITINVFKIIFSSIKIYKIKGNNCKKSYQPYVIFLIIDFLDQRSMKTGNTKLVI